MISPNTPPDGTEKRPKPPDISTLGGFVAPIEPDANEPEFRVAVSKSRVALAANKKAFIYETPVTMVSLRPNGGGLKRTKTEHHSVFAAAAAVAVRVLQSTDANGNPTKDAADMAKFLIEQGIGKAPNKTELIVKDETNDGLSAAFERLDRGIRDMEVQDILGTRPRFVPNTAIPPDVGFDDAPVNGQANGHANGHHNGHTNGHSNGKGLRIEPPHFPE